MTIRDYAQDDYNQVIELWIECGLIERHLQVTQMQLSAFQNNGILLVYTDDAQKVIGTVMGAWDGWRGWVYKLAVAEEYRRRGIGTELLNEVAARLREVGAGIIRAYIEKENEASLSLFRKRGFAAMDGFVIVTKGRQ